MSFLSFAALLQAAVVACFVIVAVRKIWPRPEAKYAKTAERRSPRSDDFHSLD